MVQATGANTVNRYQFCCCHFEKWFPGRFLSVVDHKQQPFTGSKIHLVLASNWKDPSTYKESENELFPSICGNGIEDPFLYRDHNGYFHAIFHKKYPMDDQNDVGGHAFSEDGIHWIFGGRFGNIVEFTDGT